MDVVIIDDERTAHETMRLLLDRVALDIRVVGQAMSVREAIDLLKGLEFDVLLLDIEMRDGTGFDVLEHFPFLDASIIFTTAHNDYALQAIKSNAIDYLLKPISIVELEKALTQCTRLDRNKLDYQKVLNTLRQEIYGTRIAIKSVQTIDFVQSRDIVYCQADGSYSTVFMCSGDKLTCTKSIKYFEEVTEGERFFRINKSDLINLDLISQFRKDIGFGQVSMSNGDILPVARRRKAEFNLLMKEM